MWFQYLPGPNGALEEMGVLQLNSTPIKLGFICYTAVDNYYYYYYN